jgi:TatD DNase family protein
MWMDSHAHLSSDAVFESVDCLIDRAKEVGVKKIINICTNPRTLSRGLELAKKHSCVATTGATTPHDVEKEGEEAFGHFEKAANEQKLCAIGETGLDYYYTHSQKQIQQTFLRRYLELATTLSLPVVIHCRQAFDDLFAITDEMYRGKPLVLHCFTGTIEEAKGVIDRGWMLSLSGIVTFKKSVELKEVARFVPLDRLLIETDTPYLAPQSKRGKTNEPSFLPEIGRCIAEEKGILQQVVAESTLKNGLKFFGVS